MQDGFVYTRHGRMHYLEGGAGEPLVLMHSVGCSAYEFQENFAALEKAFRVIAWDLPGHGDSEPLNKHLAVSDYADVLVDLLHARAFDRVTLCGTSFGGLLVIDLAVRFPQRVQKAYIVETPLRNEASWAAQWDFVSSLFAVPTQPFEAVAPRFKHLTPALHARWNIDRNKAGGKTMMDAMWAAREYGSAPLLETIKAPVLVVLGDKGPAVDCLDDYKRRLPGAEVAIFENCGHFPMLDEPDRFNQLLLTPT